MKYLLDFRHMKQNVGGVVTGGSLHLWPDIHAKRACDELRRESSITFLVHGYNVSREKGIEKLSELADRLPSQSGNGLVMVVWPGDHFTKFLSYPFEGRDADETGENLAKYVAEIAGLKLDRKINFVTHSLGARVGMTASTALQSRGYEVSKACLMAAAIDNSSLANPNVYGHTTSKIDQVAVLSSRKDRTLRLGYLAGDLFQAFMFADDIVDRALGFTGSKSFGSHAVPREVHDDHIPKKRNSDHGHYLPDVDVDSVTNKRHRNQLSAVGYADQILSNAPNPTYK